MMHRDTDTVEDAVERVLDALREHGSRVKPAGRDRWVAQCPAHDDRNPSLSLAQGDDAVLLRCFAGCDYRDIVDALGLEPRALFAQSRATSPSRGW